MSWQKRMQEEIDKRDRVIRQLRAKLSVACERLEMCSVGTHYTEEVHKLWVQETKIKTTAANGLKKIALMPEDDL